MPGFMDAAKAMIENIPPEKLLKIKKNYPKCNQLKHYCLAKGFLENPTKGNTFYIIKETEEVKEFIKLTKELEIGTMKFIKKEREAK